MTSAPRPVGQRQHLLAEVGLAVVDRMVRAVLARGRQLLGRTGRRDHPRAQDFADLDGRDADAPRRAVDQQRFAFGEPQHVRPAERGVGGVVGVGEGDGVAEFHAVRNREGVDLQRGGLLRQPAPVEHRQHPVARPEARDLRADLGDDARIFGAGNEGARRAALVAALDHQRGGEGDAAGPPAYAHMARPELGRRRLADFEFVERFPVIHDHRAHGQPRLPSPESALS